MERILIIEDDCATRKALTQLFEPEGYQVVTTTNGAEGFLAVGTDRPDVVILDPKMPHVGGQDVCRHIRRQSEDVPIIVLTGLSDEASRVLLLELGADDYVTKPFSPRELVARVRAVLRRTRRHQAVDHVYVGKACIDFQQMEVQREDRQVALTPQEFKLLKYFAQYPRRVVARDQLLSEVWGYDSCPSTRTVDTHVLTLRQKLEPDPSNPVHFITVHKAGYKFVP